MNFSRVRRYIGPQSYCQWPDKQSRDEMKRDVQIIQTKADQIYNKFMSLPVSQVIIIHFQKESKFIYYMMVIGHSRNSCLR